MKFMHSPALETRHWIILLFPENSSLYSFPHPLAMIKFIRKHRRMKSSTINEHRTTIARFIDERCKEVNDALIPRIFFFFFFEKNGFLFF